MTQQEWLDSLPGRYVLFEQSPVTGLGRNGAFKAIGLYIYNSVNKIVVTPITSRGNLARCEIEVPITHLPELIAALKTLVAKSPRAIGYRSPGRNGARKRL